MKWFAMRGLIFLTIVLSGGAYESDEGLPQATGSICAEDSTACVAPPGGGSPGVSSVKDDMSTARTKGRRAAGSRRRRKRRVGFSHQDIASDESLRPLLQTFRDSLSGRSEKDAVDTAAREEGATHSAADTWTPMAEEGHEVISQQHSDNMINVEVDSRFKYSSPRSDV